MDFDKMELGINMSLSQSFGFKTIKVTLRQLYKDRLLFLKTFSQYSFSFANKIALISPYLGYPNVNPHL